MNDVTTRLKPRRRPGDFGLRGGRPRHRGRPAVAADGQAASVLRALFLRTATSIRQGRPSPRGRRRVRCRAWRSRDAAAARSTTSLFQLNRAGLCRCLLAEQSEMATPHGRASNPRDGGVAGKPRSSRARLDHFSTHSLNGPSSWTTDPAFIPCRRGASSSRAGRSPHHHRDV